MIHRIDQRDVVVGSRCSGRRREGRVASSIGATFPQAWHRIRPGITQIDASGAYCGCSFGGISRARLGERVMNAIVRSRYGAPPNALELKDVEPRAVKRHKVLVRVRAAASMQEMWPRSGAVLTSSGRHGGTVSRHQRRICIERSVSVYLVIGSRDNWNWFLGGDERPHHKRRYGERHAEDAQCHSWCEPVVEAATKPPQGGNRRHQAEHEEDGLTARTGEQRRPG